MNDELTRLGEQAAISAAVVAGFEPGTLFAGRFRIVALLGRGGMGEVYRADDLKLGQAVALKLLPEPLARDPARLAQFHNEVRVAREVSHRNVCRTYDIGESDGRHFLTMEYVDGEDLASLLRRIGRVPQDRAIEIARQICVGLAAAHERGVLHRDLKPANIMIDGQGQGRITDFGLAGLAGQFGNVIAGTPAYMAPEQLTGGGATIRSDLYALGLVLFELFTGRRVFEANTLDDLRKLHESGIVRAPSSVVRDLDPTIERVILRCLEADPAQRPASALAVAAALPGGDQLAAALAAGETPSPEMVAAAGERTGLNPVIGLSILASVSVSLAILAVLADRVLLFSRLPLTKSTDTLRDRAQEIAERLGYTDTPADTAHGWTIANEYLSSPAGADHPVDWHAALATGRVPTLFYWYRTSPRALVQIGGTASPTLADPPATSGMRSVILDTQGRLIQFRAVPPDFGPPEPQGASHWETLFDAAGLPFSAFHPVEPEWTPRDYADARVAWSGPLPEIVGTTVHLDAATYLGRATFFRVVGPWDIQTRSSPQPQAVSAGRLFLVAASAIGMALLIGSALLARLNLRSGRGDRRGALQTAGIVFVTQLAVWTLAGHHYTTVSTEIGRFEVHAGIGLFSAGSLWLFYLALEPYARRYWPQLLIGWTRLLSGHIRDPLVGRDILVGSMSGALAALMIPVHNLIPVWLGQPELPPIQSSTVGFLGPRYTLAILFQLLRSALMDSLQALFGVVVIKALVRRTWLVVIITAVVFFPIAINGMFSGDHLAIDVPMTLVTLAIFLSVLLRFGLLSLVSSFMVFLTLTNMPLTADLSKAYAPTSSWLLLAVTGLAAFGFYASRGREPLFGRTLFD